MKNNEQEKKIIKKIYKEINKKRGKEANDNDTSIMIGDLLKWMWEQGCTTYPMGKNEDIGCADSELISILQIWFQKDKPIEVHDQFSIRAIYKIIKRIKKKKEKKQREQKICSGEITKGKLKQLVKDNYEKIKQPFINYDKSKAPNINGSIYSIIYDLYTIKWTNKDLDKYETLQVRLTDNDGALRLLGKKNPFVFEKNLNNKIKDFIPQINNERLDIFLEKFIDSWTVEDLKKLKKEDDKIETIIARAKRYINEILYYRFILGVTEDYLNQVENLDYGTYKVIEKEDFEVKKRNIKNGYFSFRESYRF